MISMGEWRQRRLCFPSMVPPMRSTSIATTLGRYATLWPASQPQAGEPGDSGAGRRSPELGIAAILMLSVLGRGRMVIRSLIVAGSANRSGTPTAPHISRLLGLTGQRDVCVDGIAGAILSGCFTPSSAIVGTCRSSMKQASILRLNLQPGPGPYSRHGVSGMPGRSATLPTSAARSLNSRRSACRRSTSGSKRALPAARRNGHFSDRSWRTWEPATSWW